MNRTIVIFFLACFCCGCEQWRVVSAVPEANQVIVVNAALSPQNTTTSIYVGRGERDFGKLQSSSALAIAEAEVFLTTGQSKKKLNFDPQTKLYQVSQNEFAVEAGKKYILEITVGKQKVKAECKIPEAISTPAFEARQSGRFIRSSVSWQATQANQAFMLEGYSFYRNEGVPVTTVANWDFDAADLLLSKEAGQLFSQSNEIRLNIERALPPTIDVVAEITQYDDNAVKYLSSVRNSLDSPQMSLGFFDRFSSPTIRYSNIQNGLGIMVGYNRYVVRQNIPISR
ncbi:MAG: DUF4249 family protein [Runella sp.]